MWPECAPKPEEMGVGHLQPNSWGEPEKWRRNGVFPPSGCAGKCAGRVYVVATPLGLCSRRSGGGILLVCPVCVTALPALAKVLAGSGRYWRRGGSSGRQQRLSAVTGPPPAHNSGANLPLLCKVQTKAVSFVIHQCALLGFVFGVFIKPIPGLGA